MVLHHHRRTANQHANKALPLSGPNVEGPQKMTRASGALRSGPKETPVSAYPTFKTLFGFVVDSYYRYTSICSIYYAQMF